MHSIKIKKQKLFYLDQAKLPLKETWSECRNLEDGYQAIKALKVRGAPLIGVFAAYCIAVTANKLSENNFFARVAKDIKYLKKSRPTAVNLAWALTRIEGAIRTNKNKPIFLIKKAIFQEAKKIHREDIVLCRNMACYGVRLIKKGDCLLTHCNTGFLATSGEGTALGVIFRGHKIYKDIKVYVDETRPLLQGSRLTAWELEKKRVPHTLITDNMAAYLMQKGKIDKVFVGADRIVENGDVANKIGTYNLAVIAKHHKVPFYVVAPTSTFDLRLKNLKSIPIEERDGDEVRKILGKIKISHKNVKVFNPAFDTVPNNLITAIVSDKGIVYPPYGQNIKKLINGHQKTDDRGQMSDVRK
ncbi:MAG: S-methyl-5-thioribose-1-phosphate isomerase [Candidatus Omnitrophota bacterium]|jgi:methylthioribose-1-phosphate isomerase